MDHLLGRYAGELMQARPWYIVRAPSFAGGVAIAMVVIILLTYDLIPARSCEPKVLHALLRMHTCHLLNLVVDY